MKTHIVTLLVSFLSISVSAESHYLQIKYGSENVSYPPSTPFELFDNAGKLIYTQDDLPEEFSFSKTHKLVLHPTYKDEKDVYILEDAILLKRLANINYNFSESCNFANTPNVVSARKSVIESKIKKGAYNLTLIFENGLVFNYTDGKTQAFLDDEELKVIGNYIIDSKLGRFKVSFRPSEGETWWVFEPKK